MIRNCVVHGLRIFFIFCCVAFREQGSRKFELRNVFTRCRECRADEGKSSRVICAGGGHIPFAIDVCGRYKGNYVRGREVSVQ